MLRRTICSFHCSSYIDHWIVTCLFHLDRFYSYLIIYNDFGWLCSFREIVLFHIDSCFVFLLHDEHFTHSLYLSPSFSLSLSLAGPFRASNEVFLHLVRSFQIDSFSFVLFVVVVVRLFAWFPNNNVYRYVFIKRNSRIKYGRTVNVKKHRFTNSNREAKQKNETASNTNRTVKRTMHGEHY